MYPSDIRKKISNNDLLLSTSMFSREPHVAAVIYQTNPDWVWIDQEHSPFGTESSGAICAMARQAGWRIVLRIEDLDSPRVKEGVIEQTIETLEWLGLDWDEGPVIQSEDLSAYARAMDRLAKTGRVFACDLTRGQIEGYMDLKWEEVYTYEHTPHPVEFQMYYSC